MASHAVRLADAADMAAVCGIVNHYIETTTVNFRTVPQTPADWIGDLARYGARYPWLVALGERRVLGIAYAMPWKDRAAYDWCIEVTLYVAPDAVRRGIGRALYRRLFEVTDRLGYRSQIAVALPNQPSVALHEAFGFRHAGTLRDVGYKREAWRDIGFWQRSVGSADAPPAPVAPVAGLV